MTRRLMSAAWPFAVAIFLAGCGATPFFAGSSAPFASLIVRALTNFDFGFQYVGKSTDRAFAIENTGGGSATIKPTALGSNFLYSGGAFPGIGGTCSTTIPPATSCLIVLSFAPVQTGELTATFELPYHDSTGDHSITSDLIAQGVVPGYPDTSFGSSGSASFPQTGTVVGNFDTLAQPDGKILTLGPLNNAFGSVVRFNSDGSVDSAFGNSGAVQFQVEGFPTAPQSMALDTDGSLLVVSEVTVGGGGYNVGLIRILPDGMVDMSFNSGLGYELFNPYGDNDILESSVGLQSDRKIVVAVNIRNPAPVSFGFGCARFLTDGSSDPSFGTGGFVYYSPVGAANVRAPEVFIQPDQKLLLVGTVINLIGFSIDPMPYLLRLDSLGNLDPTFGSGTGTVQFAPNSWIENYLTQSATLQPDGKILISVVAGDVFANAAALGVYRLSSDGQFDNTFGSAGFANVAFPGTFASILNGPDSVTTQADGKILFQAGSNMARLNLDGSLDTSFGNAGFVDLSVGGGFFFGGLETDRGAVVQPDGKIIISGFPQSSSSGFGLTRLWP